MRICLILEGCYPYVFGGVSTWMHQYINEMKEHEFVLWVIGANAKDRQLSHPWIIRKRTAQDSAVYVAIQSHKLQVMSSLSAANSSLSDLCTIFVTCIRTT